MCVATKSRIIRWKISCSSLSSKSTGALQGRVSVDVTYQRASLRTGGQVETGYCVGVDIGGTFTDAVIVSPDGAIASGKASSTPHDFSIGFFRAIAAGAESL